MTRRRRVVEVAAGLTEIALAQPSRDGVVGIIPDITGLPSVGRPRVSSTDTAQES